MNLKALKIIGPNLAHNYFDFGEKGNLMTILCCLICIEFDVDITKTPISLDIIIASRLYLGFKNYKYITISFKVPYKFSINCAIFTLI